MNIEQAIITISKVSLEIEYANGFTKGCFDRLRIVMPYIKSFISRHKIKKEIRFLFHLGDCLDEDIKDIPVICFTKDKNLEGDLIPNIDFFNLYLFTTLNQCREDISYEEKKDSSFFIGASTGKLKNNKRILYCKECIESHKHYGYIDNLCQEEESEWIAEYPFVKNILNPTVSIEDQLKHKVLVNIDGNTICWSRLYWQIQSNSMVVYIEKDNSKIQFFDIYDHSNCYVETSLKESIKTINDVLEYPDNKIKEIKNNCNLFCNYFDSYLKNPELFLQSIIDSAILKYV